MIKSQIFIALIVVFFRPLEAHPVQAPADYETETACAEITTDCERMTLDDCEVCVLLEGDPCTVLESSRCKGELECLPQDYALSMPENEMAYTEYTCQKSDIPSDSLPSMNFSEFEDWLKLIEKERSLEGMYELEEKLGSLGDDKEAPESEAEDSEPAESDSEPEESNSKPEESKTESKSRRRKHNKLDRDALPNKFRSSSTPCLDHLNHVSSAHQRKRQWKPKCDSEGFYLTNEAQCSTATKCWCVNRNGLATSDILPKRSAKTCPDNQN